MIIWFLRFDNSLPSVHSFEETEKSIKHVIKTFCHMFVKLKLALQGCCVLREEERGRGEREREREREREIDREREKEGEGEGEREIEVHGVGGIYMYCVF